MKKIILTVVLFLMINALSVSAHDMEYGYTHNHYDYVVIADVNGFDDNGAKITVRDKIISSESCFDNNGSHIPPKKMNIWLDEDSYAVLKNGASSIVAVIDKADSAYKVIYMQEVDSTDYKTLKIINTDITGDIAAFNDFINSGGQYCNHSFEGIFDGNGNYLGSKVTRIYDGKNTVIYSPETGYVQENYDEIKKINPISWNIIMALGTVLLFAAVAALWIVRYKKRAAWKHYIESGK